jgi:ribonucleotide monophosphatase NagD (HAD superfamily)
MRVFWQPAKVTEALTNTGTVMTLPSNITRDMAMEMVDAIPMDQIIHDLAAGSAAGVGTVLLTKGLRPADYKEMHEIPDVMIERIIEALSKKPSKFFEAFAEQLKMQG